MTKRKAQRQRAERSRWATAAFLPDLDGSVNEHQTVVWGSAPQSAVICIQVLRVPLDEYMSQIKLAYKQAKRGHFPRFLPYLLLASAGLFLALIVAQFLHVVDGDLRWTALLFLGLLVAGPLAPAIKNANEERVSDCVEQGVKELERQYVATFQLQANNRKVDDLKPVMDRVTPEVRDSIMASFDAGDQKTALSIIQTLRNRRSERAGA